MGKKHNNYFRKYTVPSTFRCDICTDRKSTAKSFSIKGCNHTYCSNCIFQYVNFKIQDNLIRLTCPASGCYRSLKHEHCRSILPPKLFVDWDKKLREDAIPVRDRLYCPYKLCSALMVKGPNFKDIIEKVCSGCHKLFCTKCMVPWHAGMNCEEFQKVHVDEREQEDIMLMQLAKINKWSRCPNCKFYVERNLGCSHMCCRCGYVFCYNCGGYLERGHDLICTKAPR
ncbi:E3 ubiquitin-protein ligase RSL1-like [Apium graveolens]|uniref:E3 ubiquitin-protein ligase RSL1-like n=1 Tax=Apium graveolens TaxID=4045 RepID=UPI003D78F513